LPSRNQSPNTIQWCQIHDPRDHVSANGVLGYPIFYRQLKGALQFCWFRFDYQLTMFWAKFNVFPWKPFRRKLIVTFSRKSRQYIPDLDLLGYH